MCAPVVPPPLSASHFEIVTYNFDGYSDLSELQKIDWDAVQAHWWSGPAIKATVQDRKQAEFLIEHSFSWNLVSRIGVRSSRIARKVLRTIEVSSHRPSVEIKPGWYY